MRIYWQEHDAQALNGYNGLALSSNDKQVAKKSNTQNSGSFVVFCTLALLFAASCSMALEPQRPVTCRHALANRIALPSHLHMMRTNTKWESLRKFRVENLILVPLIFLNHPPLSTHTTSSWSIY